MGTIVNTTLESQLKYVTLLDSDKATAHYSEYFYEKGKRKEDHIPKRHRDKVTHKDKSKEVTESVLFLCRAPQFYWQ